VGFFDDITKAVGNATNAVGNAVGSAASAVGSAVQNVAATVDTDLGAQTHTVFGRILYSNPITGGYLAAAQSGAHVVNSLAHAKDIGDAVSQLPGAIVNFYAGTGENVVKNAASTIGAITKNQTFTDVSKGIGIAQDVTQHDPVDSLSIIGGAISVAGAVVTGGGSLAPGIAGITKGVAGITAKTLAQFSAQQNPGPVGSNVPAGGTTQGSGPATGPVSAKLHWWQRLEAWLKRKV